jgi:hypothetical protein
MVVMVNSTDHQSQLNRSAEGLSADLFDDPDKAPKNPPARVSNARFKFVLLSLQFIWTFIFLELICLKISIERTLI